MSDVVRQQNRVNNKKAHSEISCFGNCLADTITTKRATGNCAEVPLFSVRKGKATDGVSHFTMSNNRITARLPAKAKYSPFVPVANKSSQRYLRHGSGGNGENDLCPIRFPFSICRSGDTGSGTYGRSLLLMRRYRPGKSPIYNQSVRCD